MDMAETGGDGVDFDYLMALIHNVVGPSDKDNVDPETSLPPRPTIGIPFEPRFECEDDDDDDFEECDSCEEGEIEYHPSGGIEGQVPAWMLSACRDTPHLSPDEEDDDEREHGNQSMTNLAQAPYFLRPLSPDCLSPQSQFDRIIGPGASLTSFEPRPPARRRPPFDSKTQPVPAPPLVRRIDHRAPPSYSLHADIFSDESDDENDAHNMTLSSISSDVNVDGVDDEGHDGNQVVHDSTGRQTSLPQLLFPHLVALGFDASITLPALQSIFQQHQAHHDSNSSEGGQLNANVLLFVALVKGVVDRHREAATAAADNQGATDDQPRPRPATSTTLHTLKHIIQPIQPDTTFPWPVFDMAQYEFGTSRPGTSFGCVVVLVNIPRVDAGPVFDAVHQLLLVHLFSMLSIPLQVILPVGPNGTTMKGHGFVEFQSRQQATLAARTLDGLRWSHTEPPIRSMLFREYHGSTSHPKEAETSPDDLTLHAMDLISEADEDGGDDNQHHTHHLTQRNEQLEYLIQYVEQDRDAILLENEELKSMVDKYRMREHEQEAALHSLTGLRKRIQENEVKYREHMARMRQNEHVIEAMRRRMSELTGNTHALHALSVSELRDLEDTLDTALYTTRAVMEQKIIEQRQALDRQVEAQQELKLCVVCLVAEKTILCLPCRHVCMCEPCSAHSEVTRCPICRLDIAERMVIFA